ncbi:MAG: DUF1294 domain-containing protein [Candidatus Thorarchaeota archaeon]|nr:MAG: DUF1294 domain-containing protein [Candidatus Thorarchaeota archaeon]
MQFTGVLFWVPIFYVIVINIIAFLVMWWDKRKASQYEWRVAEATLHVLGFLGGAFGVIGGMYRFRHKTQKRSFQAIVVLGLVVSLVIYWFVGIQYL